MQIDEALLKQIVDEVFGVVEGVVASRPFVLMGVKFVQALVDNNLPAILAALKLTAAAK